jgi:hypothetical protein
VQNSEIVSGDVAKRLGEIKAQEPSLPLELRSAQTFKSGVLNLSYARAEERD